MRGRSNASTDPTGAMRAPEEGCTSVETGCICGSSAGEMSCGRTEIPTDPANFRHDLYFVTPCCASDRWPDSGACTCENRPGAPCAERRAQLASGEEVTICECGDPSGGFFDTGAEAPEGDLAACDAPQGGKCCAQPGLNGGSPYLGCACGPGIVTCEGVYGDGAVEVDRCEGEETFSPYCPNGTHEVGVCHAPNDGGGSDDRGGCTADSDCGSCQRCERSTGNCISRPVCR